MTLKPFDDRDVTQCAIRIVRAGDGLSDALDADPVEIALDETVFVVLRGVVTKITYEPIGDTDVLRRVHTVRANFGTLVDEDAAKTSLVDAQNRVDKARGVERLPL